MEDESLIVLDTHVLVWWVSGAQRLSVRAKRAIDREVKRGPVTVSTISVLEIAAAVRRERLTLGVSLHAWLADLMQYSTRIPHASPPPSTTPHR